MAGNITRHFVTLDGHRGKREVHYRRCGRGPALLMLHQSPQSSVELEPLMEAWGAHFTTIAPDTPGYGQSDPLGIDPATLDDFAGATREFLDAIGLKRCGVYGFHTGGMIGLALAHRCPERVAAFACNGVVAPDDDELAEILRHYMPPFEPRWDGGHLAWLWSRNREQTIFFPWFNHTLAGRMDFPMYPPDRQHAGVIEFLRAGRQYHVAYRAAFSYRAERVVPKLSVTGLITASAMDPVQPQLARLVGLPDCVRLERADQPDEAIGLCLDQLREHPGDEPPAPPVSGPVAGRLVSRFVAVAGGAVRVRTGGPGTGRPLVLLHGAGRSGASLESLAIELSRRRFVIVIDLPGHGDADGQWPPGQIGIGECAGAVDRVLEAFDVSRVDVVGVGGGACVALELLRGGAERIGRLACIDAPIVDARQAADWRESGLPDFAPDWAGGHLQRCWHMVRDGRLYFPWFRRDRSAIVWQEPALDDWDIQLEVNDYLQSDGHWQALFAEQLDYPFAAAVATGRERPTLLSPASSPWHALNEQAARNLSLPFVELGAEPPAWATPLLQCLD